MLIPILIVVAVLALLPFAARGLFFLVKAIVLLIGAVGLAHELGLLHP